MKDDIFKIEALKQCNKSNFRARVGAVVICDGEIVGKGFNITHSRGIYYYDSRHAEMTALINTPKKFREKSTVYVCRILRNGNLALSKPCHACHVKMKKMGVKYVVYSTNNQTWEKLLL